MKLITAWAVGLVVPKLGAQGTGDLLGLVAADSRQVAALAAAIASRTRPDLTRIVVKVPAARLVGQHEQWAGARGRHGMGAGCATCVMQSGMPAGQCRLSLMI